jgi:type III secretory pathway component EscS
MERLLQYLDDCDDLFGAFGLLWEPLRRALLRVFATSLLIVVAAAAVGLALLQPLLALATSTLLFVVLLYRSVTVPSARWHRAA